MIYINPLDPIIIECRNIHYKNLRCLINKKLGGPNCVSKCGICLSGIKRVSINVNLEQFILNKIDEILCGTPERLLELNNEFWSLIINGFNISNWSDYIAIDQNGIKAIKDSLEKIFSYKNWFCNKDSKYYSAYDLSKKLDRNTCTYCNRIYTSTIINRNGKKIIRTTLDHWFPKSKFPLLALSFYNLIPSCSNCNSSVKGATDFDLAEHIHPYIDITQNEDFLFKFNYNKKLNNYKIYIESTKKNNLKAKNTLKKMFIDEMYNSHQCELKDLIKIEKNYSVSYIESIEKLFKSKLARDEVYRMLFGVEYDAKKFHKLPLSKFKSDILKQLNII